MQTKLTLRLDEKLIELAKAYAREKGKSLSQMVADYFLLLTKIPAETTPGLPPTVRSLKGALRGADIDESDYRRHLEEKYL